MTQKSILSMMGLADLRQQTLGDPEICVAIIDSRVDLLHPTLAGAQLKEIVPGWLSSRMGSGGASHGTHVASIIFGQPGGGVEGIAPRCRGIIIPVYTETEAGELAPCSQEDLARAISIALEAGAHLINISGGELIKPGDVDVFLTKAVRSCDQLGVVVVAATGNEGCECLHAPASLPTVLAVGAADANGLPMPFSNWDESLASHGVLAPGEGIPGAVPGGDVALHNGTSFACPIVTGAAALLLSLSRLKLNGGTPNPKAVRDAIINSAVPCTPDEHAECERMLGGRLNVRGAYEFLFKDSAVSPSAGDSRGARSEEDSIRSPPIDVGAMPVARSRSAVDIYLSTSPQKEATVMMHEQFQEQPGTAAAIDRRTAPPQVVHAQTSAQPTATAVRPSGVLPQGCSCQSGQLQQGMSPSQDNTASGHQYAAPAQEYAAPAHQHAAPAQEYATPAHQHAAPAQEYAAPAHQHAAPAQQYAAPVHHYAGPALENTAPVQQPIVPAYHGGIPAPTPIGMQPALSPAQRTALLGGYPGSASGQQMAISPTRGVTPSQASTACPCPMPNDFISAENSQLIYVIGQIGYDFITDARRDYFTQQMKALSDESDRNGNFYIDIFKETLGLQSGVTYYPEDHRAMAAYIYQQPRNPDDPNAFPTVPSQFAFSATARAADIGSLVWVLFQRISPFMP